MGKTGIEWTDETWPITRGCEQVSPGCKNCYAKHMAARIVRMGKGAPTKYDGLVRLTKGGDPQWTGAARFCPEELATPLRKRTPRKIFPSSMSDLFHDDITNEQIAAAFGVMAMTPHTYQIVTKRAARLPRWFEWVASTGYAPGHVLSMSLGDLADREPGLDDRFSDDEWLVGLINVVNGHSSLPHHDDGNPLDGSRPRWPLPNVWLGVSVENQAAADERIPELLRTPAAVRFLSCEPLLGELDLGRHLWRGCSSDHGGCGALWPRHKAPSCSCARPWETRGISWVIAGCESGPGARPAEVDWLRSLRDQCAEAGVPFFLKQAVETADGLVTEGPNEPGGYPAVFCGDDSHRKPGGIIGAPYLDGVQHRAFPEVRRG